MELIYVNSDILDVKIMVPVLNNKLTKQEKIDFFGSDSPNTTVYQNVTWLEKDERNQDGTPKTTLELTVQSMVTQWLITQQRANEILA